jgi:hypothetical protein
MLPNSRATKQTSAMRQVKKTCRSTFLSFEAVNHHLAAINIKQSTQAKFMIRMATSVRRFIPPCVISPDRVSSRPHVLTSYR